MLYPLCFRPLFKERVWGGRTLERLYGKPLPRDVPIGESWEISDRPGNISVVENGPLAGRDLHWVLEQHPRELLGRAKPQAGRFPLLVKILDAQDKLSLQVHPPPGKAVELQGEPKTEMWYIAEAAPGAELYVGLKQGVTRSDFERSLQAGSVAECFHRVPVKAGDTMFLPSGRVHAIGAGLLIFEIQQNSDTTYRVFDWNRVGLDGKPRALHVTESLASIDFADFEPAPVAATWRTIGAFQSAALVTHPLFEVDLLTTAAGGSLALPRGILRIIGAVEGTVEVSNGANPVTLPPGRFCLAPAGIESFVQAGTSARFLVVRPGDSGGPAFEHPAQSISG
jgi:mannose-6-phosphate isomerase